MSSIKSHILFKRSRCTILFQNKLSCQRKTALIPLRVFCYPAYLADDTIKGMVRLHWRRWNIKGTPPDLHLGLPMFSSRLSLIEASQATIVPLIKTPGPHHRQPHLINGIQHSPEGTDGPLLHRCEADVKLIASIWKSQKSVMLIS